MATENTPGPAVWLVLLGWLLPLPLAAECSFAPPSKVAVHGRHGCATFMLQLAHLPQQRRCGLSGRSHLAMDHGMLFDFRGSTSVSMWMKDTKIPLDMLFVDAKGKVTAVHARAEPYSEQLIHAPFGTAAVLELAAGVAADRGLGQGGTILHHIFANTQLAPPQCRQPALNP
ncbi:MAG: DUF192 domain-containing protein [Candidatus Porifericomitaceae bacterium WSBS_2022_MAG_OTU9]